MADLRAMMMRKAGPLPVWAWTGLSASVIAGFMFFRKGQTPAQPPGAGAGPGGQGDFKSSSTVTKTDADGNTYVTQYEASGMPQGFMTTQASPMPYSLGDIYNNQTVTVPQSSNVISLPRWEPAQPTPAPPVQWVTQPAPAPPPPAPPPPAPPPAPAPEKGIRGTWTVVPGDNLYNIAKVILRSRWDREATPGEITWFWKWIYDVNRNVIGGNPSLIHPGKHLILP